MLNNRRHSQGPLRIDPANRLERTVASAFSFAGTCVHNWCESDLERYLESDYDESEPDESEPDESEPDSDSD